ncbi:MAG TPA: hypothetical protein VMB47_02950 [Candidatus Aquilonibacter sp.]|nr:hypothetical protein [Candidatus Aquilonibacter sp.]
MAAFSQMPQPARVPVPAAAAPPIAWEDELRDLAAEIAKLAPPPARINLLVNNISSLTPEQVSPIQSALRMQLANHGVRFGNGDAADTTVQVTLSEGIEGYVAVAQVKRDGAEQVAMVTVPRTVKSAPSTGGVLLDAKLVWQQPTEFLDFALPLAQPGEQTILAVLEPTRLVFYSQGLASWQFAREVDSDLAWVTRDWRGHIDLSQVAEQGPNAGDARWQKNECKGDFEHPNTVTCAVNERTGDAWIAGDMRPPFIPPGGGDAVSIALQCRSHSIALATGGGDWTEADFIQGYELLGGPGQAASASGNRINFLGPVMAIWPANAPGAARAVVHNLQTGNYEAYVVAATCSQ